MIRRKFALNLALLALLLTPIAAAAQGDAVAPATSPLASLQSRIAARLAAPEIQRGSVGIKVVSLDTGRVVFEQNGEKYFMPASNMKNFTVAAALERLGPEYRFPTIVFSRSRPGADGTVSGPLRVYGSGDVSISYTFNEDDHFRGIDRLADAIAAAGVKRVDGDIIADETYFKGSALPTGWEWDDLQFYYGAEVSALPVNDNVVRLSVTPGPAGYGCSVRLTPAHLLFRVENRCMTTPAGTPRTLSIHKKIGQNALEITGGLPIGNAGYSGFVSVSRPAEMFAAMLKQRLAEKGIAVTGRTYAMNDRSTIPTDLTTQIAMIESPPLSEIAARTMKPSQNMYTETLLWTLGEQARAKAGTAAPLPAGGTEKTSSELGREAVREFLKSIGIAEDAVLQSDGSGLSRHNLVTPASVVDLYVYMAKSSRHSDAWRNSLTIAGVDGTLRNRFKGTRGEANVRGKTGTINQVSALSGYLTTAGGEQLVFTALVNGVPQTSTRVGLIDEVVTMLVNFDSKVD